MEFKKFLKNFIYFGALNNTVISAIFIIFAVINEPAAENVQYCTACGMPQNIMALESHRFLAILVFSFIMAAGSAFFRINGITKLAAILTHAALFIFGFFSFLLLCDITFSKAIIATVLFSAIYIIERLVQSLITKAIKKHGTSNSKGQKNDRPASKNDGYKSQFSK